MTIEKLIKKYNIRPVGDKIRVERIPETNENELDGTDQGFKAGNSAVF